LRTRASAVSAASRWPRPSGSTSAGSRSRGDGPGRGNRARAGNTGPLCHIPGSPCVRSSLEARPAGLSPSSPQSNLGTPGRRSPMKPRSLLVLAVLFAALSSPLLFASVGKPLTLSVTPDAPVGAGDTISVSLKVDPADMGEAENYALLIAGGHLG